MSHVTTDLPDTKGVKQQGLVAYVATCGLVDANSALHIWCQVCTGWTGIRHTMTEPQKEKSDLKSNARHLRSRRHHCGNPRRDLSGGMEDFVESSDLQALLRRSVYHRVGRGRVTEIKNCYSCCCPVMQTLEYLSLHHKMKIKYIKYFHNSMWGGRAGNQRYMLLVLCKMQKCEVF